MALTPNVMAASTDDDRGRRLFLSELAVIERVIRQVCSRCHVKGSEVEDFSSWSKLRLIHDDYAALRDYRGESQFTTYITVVIRRHLVDYQAAMEGRWRASTAARRGGPILIDLERLLMLDGRPLEEAALLLAATHGPIPIRDLEAMAASLPVRHRRRFEGDETLLGSLPSGEPAPDATVDARERREAIAAVRPKLRRAIETLLPQDRLILALRFEDGQTVADIATLLRLDQKRLYRHIEGLLRQLRRQLEAEGLAPTIVDIVFREVGDWPTAATGLAGPVGTVTSRPSIAQGVKRGPR